MIVQMLGVAAEFERAMVSDRTKKALAAAKARGVVLGRPAEMDAATVGIIRTKRTEGSTLEAIAEHLNAHGLKTPRGVAWSLANVQQVLARTGGDPRPAKRGRPRKVGVAS
jgi:DNA invertase Pin-like site-specific DNA recombinase